MSTSSNLLQAAGVVALVCSPAHYIAGLQGIQPTVAALAGAPGVMALGGWYQGSFGYAVFGLNYLRLATVRSFTVIDIATLVVQLGMHAFSALYFKEAPPRVASVVLIALVGGGLLLR